MIDTQSSTWFAVERFVMERLAISRSRLEAPLQDVRMADHLRGEIAALEALLAAAAEETPIAAPVDNFD